MSISIPSIPIRKTISNADKSWARVVSDVLSPPVVWTALAFPIAFRDAQTDRQALLWATIYILLVCILPVAYIGFMVWRGKITDMHMRERKQRLLPYLVTILSTFFAWWTLRFMHAPPVVPLFAMFSLIQTIIMALITLAWQISMHSMSITGATMATSLLFGTIPALLTIPLIVLVSAARLNLKRHTPAQILAGTVLGALLPAVILLVMYS